MDNAVHRFRGLLVYNTVASTIGFPGYMDLWYLMFAKVNWVGGTLKVLIVIPSDLQNIFLKPFFVNR